MTTTLVHFRVSVTLSLGDIISSITVQGPAERWLLPPDFRRWSMSDRNGRTVAHEAARLGVLPVGFDHWDLTDKFGRTVADEAA